MKLIKKRTILLLVLFGIIILNITGYFFVKKYFTKEKVQLIITSKWFCKEFGINKDKCVITGYHKAFYDLYFSNGMFEFEHNNTIHFINLKNKECPIKNIKRINNG